MTHPNFKCTIHVVYVAACDRPLKPQLIGCSFLGTTQPSAWFLLTTHRAHSLGLQDGSCCGQGAEGSRK